MDYKQSGSFSHSFLFTNKICFNKILQPAMPCHGTEHTRIKQRSWEQRIKIIIGFEKPGKQFKMELSLQYQY